jgi:hypothetical protein
VPGKTVTTCWDKMCGADCAWCRYKQERYRKGFPTLCYDWFREKGIEKKCRTCAFYLDARQENPQLPEDPAWHPAPADSGPAGGL